MFQQQRWWTFVFHNTILISIVQPVLTTVKRLLLNSGHSKPSHGRVPMEPELAKQNGVKR
jgi:hypothetical protein